MAKPKINNFIKPSKKTNILYRMPKSLRIILLVLASILILLTVLYAIYQKPAKNTYSYAMNGKDSFFLAQDQLLNQDFTAAESTLASAVDDFEQAQIEFNKLKWLKIVPWLGSQISAVDYLLSAGIDTGKSIQTINDIAITIITPLQTDDEISLNSLSEEQTRSLLENIYQAKPELVIAKSSIDQAVDNIDKINQIILINKIKDIVTDFDEKTVTLQEALDQAISASQIIPSIAGYPEEKIYLFLLQNNSEIRPTGGFIGTYGILKVKNGDIDNFNTDNVYNLDEPVKDTLYEEPPWPLTRYNAVHQWFFRDSNWSPDFPTSAQKAEWFYYEEGGSEKNIHGVIAVTPTFISSLLDLTGEIQVNGLTFNSENLVDTLQYQVNQGYLRQGLDLSERKEIIGVLSKKILDSLLDLPKNKWPDLWKIFSKNILEKQVLMYMKDDYIQNLIIKENWGGDIRQVSNDYVAVFDANLASLKSDPAVNRSIDYTIQRDGDNIIADITIAYNHTGDITWKTTRYRTYTRVYVPAGSTLLDSQGMMVDCKLEEEGSVETVEEFNKTSFGTFICVEPGESKTLHYKYKLPNTITEQFKNNTYDLLVQKQPGTSAYPLTISINLKNKPKAVFKPDEFSLPDNHTVQIDTTLSQDKNISIRY